MLARTRQSRLPAKVTGAFEISEKTPDATFVNYDAKVQVHVHSSFPIFMYKIHRCFC